MRIDIKPGDQVFVRGDKGSGKTTLCMALVSGEPAVVLDPKHERDEWIGWAKRSGAVVTRDPADVGKYRRVVVLVDQLWLDDREGWKKPGSAGWAWSMVLENIWRRRNTVVVWEEPLQTLPSTGANPRARRILTQGRVPGLTSLIPLQITNWIDTLGPRLAGHYITFRCQDQDELGAMKKARGPFPEIARTLADRDFAYHASGSQSWIRCRHLPPELVAQLRGGRNISGHSQGVNNAASEAEEEAESQGNAALAEEFEGAAP